jgi:hypothetical protein
MKINDKKLNIALLAMLGLTAYGITVIADAAAPVHDGVLFFAQSVKTRTLKGYGLTVKITGQQVYVDGKPAALEANEDGNLTYSQGLNTLIVYKSGKVALVQSGQFTGYLK